MRAGQIRDVAATHADVSEITVAQAVQLSVGALVFLVEVQIVLRGSKECAHAVNEGSLGGVGEYLCHFCIPFSAGTVFPSSSCSVVSVFDT